MCMRVHVAPYRVWVVESKNKSIRRAAEKKGHVVVLLEKERVLWYPGSWDILLP